MKNRIIVWSLAFLVVASLSFGEDAKPRRLTPAPIPQVVIDDEFWSPKLKVWREVTMPDCFAKFEKDGALTNFDKIRNGTGGEHGRPPWYDGLIYEMIRGGADFLAAKRDPALETRLDVGRVALQRSPLVYCLEAVDNNGHVRNLVISPDAPLRAQRRADLLGGVTVIQGPALAVHRAIWPDQLYLPSVVVPGITNTQFTAIPYFANANRQAGEMEVWIASTGSHSAGLKPPLCAWKPSSNQIGPAASSNGG